MSNDVMVIDYDRCVRYKRDDEWMRTTGVPHRCPVCARGVKVERETVDNKTGKPNGTTMGDTRYLTAGSFSAKLSFDGKAPYCENHRQKILMVPV